MNYPKDIYHFVNDLVDDYAKYNSINETYCLDVLDIPDFMQYEFAVKMMSLNDSWASEATGPDNGLYATKMLPALMRYMAHSTDRDEEIEFVKEWRDGVSSYFHKELQELIDDACNDKLHSKMDDAGFLARRRPDNGELYWSRC